MHECSFLTFWLQFPFDSETKKDKIWWLNHLFFMTRPIFLELHLDCDILQNSVWLQCNSRVKNDSSHQMLIASSNTSSQQDDVKY